jgi:hypothetical protein
VLVDLGTASTPVVNGVSAAFNPCSGASVCP